MELLSQTCWGIHDGEPELYLAIHSWLLCIPSVFQSSGASDPSRFQAEAHLFVSFIIVAPAFITNCVVPVKLTMRYAMG